jgi:hypothetical protein
MGCEAGALPWFRVGRRPSSSLSVSFAAGAFDVSEYPEELRPYPPDPLLISAFISAYLIVLYFII